MVSSSDSWHNGKMPCQESGHMRGSVGSCASECVYKVPCANCDKTYGEVRLQEHRTEVESKKRRTFTRSHPASSLTEHNKSALTDHATQENHVINWSQATVIDRARAFYQMDQPSERKDNRPWTVMRAATNWATHTTAFLTRHLPVDAVVSRIGRTECQLLLTKASDRGRNVKRVFLGNYIGCVWWIN